MKVRKGALILGSLLLMLVGGAALAETGDGETPAEESVCDILQGGTPGLYGLCVAYCEAHDCHPDPSTMNFVSHCKPGSPKVLAAYNKKKKESDPDMPCRIEGCPCFSVDELLSLSPYAECTVDGFDTGGNLFTQVVSDRSAAIVGNVIIVGQDRFCFFNDGATSRISPLDTDEYAVCKERLLDAMEFGSCP